MRISTGSNVVGRTNIVFGEYHAIIVLAVRKHYVFSDVQLVQSVKLPELVPQGTVSTFKDTTEYLHPLLYAITGCFCWCVLSWTYTGHDIYTTPYAFSIINKQVKQSKKYL